MQASIAALAITALLCACGSRSPAGERSAVDMGATPNAAAAEPASPAPGPAPDKPESVSSRLELISSAIGRWRNAADLPTARAAAEEARNLVAGPDAPFYGDSDGNGVVGGASATGLLPGMRGEPGLASSAANACVSADVLGGNWQDPALRWARLKTAISRWTPANNTFPALPSHPQRIIGWATLALAAKTPATAREYARHAQIHADVSVRALTACGG